jgi:hypothetical protein
MSGAALEPTQTPVQRILGFILVVKQLALDVNPLPPTSTEVKK